MVKLFQIISVEHPLPDYQSLKIYVSDEDILLLKAEDPCPEEEFNVWTMFFDEVANSIDFGVRAILFSPFDALVPIS